MKGRSKLVKRRSEPDLKDMAKKVAAAGTGRDTVLAHITPQEAKLLKARGGSGLINRRTGLPSFEDGPDGPSGSGTGAPDGGTGGLGDGASDNGGTGGTSGGSEGTSGPANDGEGVGGSPTGNVDGIGNAGLGSLGMGTSGLGNPNAPSDLGPTTSQVDAISNAIDAGVFGGIGSANPEAAANAQAGLAANGLGSAAAVDSSFGLGFASAMASVFGATPFGGLISNNPMAGFGLASLAAPPGLATGLSAIGKAAGLAGFGSKDNVSGPSAATGNSGAPGGTGGANDTQNTQPLTGATTQSTTTPSAPVTGGTGGASSPSGYTAPQVTPPSVPVANNPLLPSPDTYANAFNQFGANGQAPQRKLEAYINASGRLGYRYV